MKSYFDDLRLRLREGLPFPDHLIDHAATSFRLGGFVENELDYANIADSVEQRLRVRDEAHMTILRANIAQYGLGIRRPVLLPRITVAAALAGHVWTFPPIKETHKAAYDAIRNYTPIYAMTFDSVSDLDVTYIDLHKTFKSRGTVTGRWSSTTPNYSAPPSSAVYAGARGNGKTFVQQNAFEQQFNRDYLIRPYQREMFDAIRALHAKGWKL